MVGLAQSSTWLTLDPRPRNPFPKAPHHLPICFIDACPPHEEPVRSTSSSFLQHLRWTCVTIYWLFKLFSSGWALWWAGKYLMWIASLYTPKTTLAGRMVEIRRLGLKKDKYYIERQTTTKAKAEFKPSLVWFKLMYIIIPTSANEILSGFSGAEKVAGHLSFCISASCGALSWQSAHSLSL